MHFAAVSLLLFCSLVVYVTADIPVNCTYEDIRGTWEFYEGERSGDSDIDCTNFRGPTANTLRLDLLFPNVVLDELGNKGFWTMVNNQGFEVVINYRKFFAFSKYEKIFSNVTISRCDRILRGWSHDVLGKNWACYDAQKVGPSAEPKLHFDKTLFQDGIFRQDKDFVKRINGAQKSWTATVYPEFEGVRISDIVRRAGGLKSRIQQSPRIESPYPYMHSKDFFDNYHLLTMEKKVFARLPEQFDWRNVGGVNYVSPVRNQGNCGSCFAFASMAMFESRLRIATNNTVQVTFSPQDVVSCSEYSQGCEGGFPYLIAGKYAQDFGVVPEECNPYTGRDDKCSEKKCKRYYVADYKFVGGFYGACNEDLMKLELVSNGPMVISYEVFPDFRYYQRGIYHHTKLSSSRFNPVITTNHAVLAVGYGVDRRTGEKYWIVKNSWGTKWGEDGYFRIRRGTNECNIESVAVAATIIP